MPDSAPDVFSFLEYRAFLRAFYTWKKKTGRGFSYRAFARRAGLRSPNHLKRVIDGDRHLGEEAMPGYVLALGLSGDPERYFRELVRFAQCKTLDEQRRSHARLTDFQGYRKASHLDAEHREYHSEWFIPAIREMVGCEGFKSDAASIAQRLVPPISIRQAKRALSVLVKLEMIQQDPQGEWQRTDAMVSTGVRPDRLQVADFYTAMSDKAMASIEGVASELRDISSVTLCIKDSQIPLLKERLASFRREILAMEEATANDRVVHVNLQLFPLSTPFKDSP